MCLTRHVISKLDGVVITENRPGFRDPGKWTAMTIAQFRFDPKSGKWTLYCADRNEKWHEYGGLSVALGYRAKYGDWLLVLFLVPVTVMLHSFWTVKDPMMAQMQPAMFMKNLTMLGGALIVGFFGSGPLSLDARRKADQTRSRESAIAWKEPILKRGFASALQLTLHAGEFLEPVKAMV